MMSLIVFASTGVYNIKFSNTKNRSSQTHSVNVVYSERNTQVVAQTIIELKMFS